MAQITAAMVKQLREMTDSPMMECKKALVEADGDMDAAVDVLRKNGLAKAAKKAGRETNEGAVAAFVSEDGKTGALLELSCETDFVGSNAKFTGFASKVAEVVATTEPADVDALLEKPMGEETVSSELTEMIHIMGENMKISRFAARKAENGALASYIHMGGKIGVLVEFAFEKAETAQAESFKTFAHDRRRPDLRYPRSGSGRDRRAREADLHGPGCRVRQARGYPGEDGCRPSGEVLQAVRAHRAGVHQGQLPHHQEVR